MILVGQLMVAARTDDALSLTWIMEPVVAL
jgi:hypothetical protein